MKLTQKISVIRKLALQFLKKNYVQAIIVVLMCNVLLVVPSMIVEVFAPKSDFLFTAINLYSLFMRGPLNLAITVYFISLFRNKNVGAAALGYGFNNTRAALELFIRQYLRIFIASFAFIIPGIVLTVKYAFSFYILADNPGLSARDCMRLSSEMLNGNAKRYIKLFLSFAPLYIVCLLPRIAYVYFSIGGAITEITREALLYIFNLFYSPIATAIGLCTLICEVWFQTSKACVYDILSGKLVFESAEVTTCEA